MADRAALSERSQPPPPSPQLRPAARPRTAPPGVGASVWALLQVQWKRFALCSFSFFPVIANGYATFPARKWHKYPYLRRQRQFPWQRSVR